MAYFECIKTHTEGVSSNRVQVKVGTSVRVEERIRDVKIVPSAYGYENIKVGDVLEINGHLALKAGGNTEYFKEVDKPEKLSKLTKAKRTSKEVTEQIKESQRSVE